MPPLVAILSAGAAATSVFSATIVLSKVVTPATAASPPPAAIAGDVIGDGAVGERRRTGRSRDRRPRCRPSCRRWCN